MSGKRGTSVRGLSAISMKWRFIKVSSRRVQAAARLATARVPARRTIGADISRHVGESSSL